MRKLTFLLTFFMLLGSVHLQAKEYAIKDIPMVHLQNRTRYVSNPDGILSSTAVTTMDSILYALEQKTGIQTLVVAVTGIEGGDCFDFAHRLGQETGVGQKERDNGLVILLSTDERCVQFATGALKGYCRMPSANGFRTAICCPISRTITGTPEW